MSTCRAVEFIVVMRSPCTTGNVCIWIVEILEVRSTVISLLPKSVPLTNFGSQTGPLINFSLPCDNVNSKQYKVAS